MIEVARSAFAAWCLHGPQYRMLGHGGSERHFEMQFSDGESYAFIDAVASIEGAKSRLDVYVRTVD